MTSSTGKNHNRANSRPNCATTFANLVDRMPVAGGLTGRAVADRSRQCTDAVRRRLQSPAVLSILSVGSARKRGERRLVVSLEPVLKPALPVVE